MGWSQGLESWSGVRLPYWSGFLKWNPGGMLRVAQELLFFFFNTKKLSDMGVNFNHSHYNHSHTMIKQIIYDKDLPKCT